MTIEPHAEPINAGPTTDGPWLPRPEHPALSALRRFTRRFLVLAVVVGVLVACHRPILNAYASLFRIDEPTRSDLIVLLLGGPDHRPARAAELFRAGYAPKVLFCSAGDAVAEFTSETEVTSRMLAKHGVPIESQIRLPDLVMSTRDEAAAVRRRLLERPVSRILLVTSDFHTRRARWIFRRTLADLNVEVNVASARPPHEEGVEWYMRDESLILYFIESVKTLVYWIRY